MRLTDLWNDLCAKNIQQNMKVFVDYFGTIITQKCYQNYLIATVNDTLNNVDFPYIRRKCQYRSFAFYDIWKNVRDYEELFYFNDAQLEQMKLFELRSSFAFLLAIAGDTFDSFRIWEGLVFNSIVITKYYDNQFNRMLMYYKKELDLPIVFVDKYADINATSLRMWYDKYSPFTSFNNNKTRYHVTNEFWMKYMKGSSI